MNPVQAEFLKRYYEMLYPEQLREDEYVCLFMQKEDENGEEFKFHKFVKSFDQYLECVNRYKRNYNVFNALATVRKRDGELLRKEQFMRQRRVLFLDFDKKDYPGLNDAHDFTKKIKEKFKDLFLHAYYDSGHGYHYYIIIKPTCKIREITELNKEIAGLVGADTNACKVTQIARVPTTFNLKHKHDDEKFPLVKEIDHYKKHDYSVTNFHPCNVDYIQRQVNNCKKIEETLISKPLEEWNYSGDSYYNIPRYPCLCTQKVLMEGADETERNAWLGRIISMLLHQGYTESKVRETCVDWNTRCRPPKPSKQLSGEINAYLEKKDIYKLNGCYDKISDPRISEIVKKQCDKYHCEQAFHQTSISLDTDAGVKMSQKILTKSRLQRNGSNEFSGQEYLLMTVIDKYIKTDSSRRRPFTIKDLKYRLQYKKGGKWQLCMDLSTFKSAVEALIEHKCIDLKEPTENQCKKKRPSYDDQCISLKRGLKVLDENYIEFYYSVAKAFICKQITPVEYKVFLCIINNMKNGKSCTLEDLDKILNMGTQNISRAIKNLDIAQCITVVQYGTDSGNFHNVYSHKQTGKWDNDTDNSIEVDIPKTRIEMRLLA